MYGGRDSGQPAGLVIGYIVKVHSGTKGLPLPRHKNVTNTAIAVAWPAGLDPYDLQHVLVEAIGPTDRMYLYKFV